MVPSSSQEIDSSQHSTAVHTTETTTEAALTSAVGLDVGETEGGSVLLGLFEGDFDGL